MNIYFSTYKKYFTAITLVTYLFISGYSIFHFHQTDYSYDIFLNVEQETSTNYNLHQNGFCQIFHYNNSQFIGDNDSISDCEPSEIITKQSAFTYPLISSEVNSLLRRGPPFLS